MINWKKIFLGLLIVFIDLVVYIFIGLILLGYEDFYDESKGLYWSLESMTFSQKTAYISWYIWWVINSVIIIYILFCFLKQLKKHSFKK